MLSDSNFYNCLSNSELICELEIKDELNEKILVENSNLKS